MDKQGASNSPDPVIVAAAAIESPDGRILLTRRHDHTHQGGLWEFPGGKVDPGETIAEALHRELHEELGIRVTAHHPLIRVHHRYPDKHVLLDIHRVTAFEGEPHGREGQPLAWVEPERLGDYPMPAADVPIVNAVQLPGRYVFTPASVQSPDDLLRGIEAVIASGTRLIQLRVFDVADDLRRNLARDAAALCKAAGALLMVNADPELAVTAGAQGVHLNSRQLMALERRPGGLERVAVSCHNPAELARAVELGLDFAVLSPVLPTPSHPDANPLGWERFQAWVDEIPMPVYALGGMRADLLDRAREAGAQGVAGIRGLWPAP
jgi:8-oxo-dGTP diphosphatase